MNRRWKIVTWLTIQATEISGFVLRERNWKYRVEDYKKMKVGSLGWKYHKLVLSGTIQFKANLIKHDMKHIILGYDMTIKNELNIVAFLLGNKSANKVSTLYLITCLLFVPEYFTKLRKHYKRGQIAHRIKDYNLSNFVEMDLKSIQKTLNIPEFK
ncbi:MAG: hypothetical protein AB8B72_04255 [Crocinitomicaceae bacterium]